MSNRQKLVDQLVKAEGTLYLLQKDITRMVEDREQLKREIEQLRKQLYTDNQSQLTL
jgi:regulator of replication initiation timing